ncbi:MAG: G8 domain-containing protein [Deltaproteobacteria bacterium]
MNGILLYLALAMMMIGSAAAKSVQPGDGHHHHDKALMSPPASDIMSVSGGDWSNAKIWSAGRVPKSGEAVLISKGTVVSYDINSEAELKSVTVQGSLAFSRGADTTLDLGRLVVHEGGDLEIGTAENPLLPQFTARIRLTEDSRSSPNLHSDMQAVEEGGLIVMGRAEIHGSPKSPAFAALARTALPGDRTIELTQAPSGWRAGDEIVLTGDFDQSETARIKSISAGKIELAGALKFEHPVIIYKSSDGKTLEFRSHAGNLSRNIKIMSKRPDKARGHTMLMGRGAWRISYVEYRNLGGFARPFPEKTLLQPLLGRYPIHFHQLGTASSDTLYVRGASIVGTENHALRIHGTDRVIIEDTIAYDTLGHSFDIGEDGSEMENVIRRNLAVKARSAWNLASTPEKPRATFFEQNTDAAGFWFGNMGQIVENNISSDTKRGFGMYKIRPTPPNRLMGGKVVEPNDIAFKKFANNEVYGANIAAEFYHFVGTDAGVIEGMKIWMCKRDSRIKTSAASKIVWKNPIVARTRVCSLCADGAVKLEGQTIEQGYFIDSLQKVAERNKRP